MTTKHSQKRPWADVANTVCPVGRTQSIIGDRWTVLILRELFIGNRRFDEIQAQTETTPQMLAARLKKLVADGLVEKRPYSTRPPRHEYVLSEKGEAFHPVLLALRAWGETWCKSPGEGPAVRYIHHPCGQDPGLGPLCQSCGMVMRRPDLTGEPSPDYAWERERRHAAFHDRLRKPISSREH